MAAQAVVGVMHGHQFHRRMHGLQALLQAERLAEGDEVVVLPVHDE